MKKQPVRPKDSKTQETQQKNPKIPEEKINRKQTEFFFVIQRHRYNIWPVKCTQMPHSTST